MSIEAPDWITSLFGDVNDDIRAHLESKLTSRHLPRGGQLFESGDPATELYVLRSGKMKLSRRYDDDPRRESLLTVLGDGQVFGELSVLDPGPRTTTASAITVCELGVLSSTDLKLILQAYPEIAEGLMRQLARRLRHATDYASDLVLNDVNGRTARTLQHLTELFGEPSSQGTIVRHGLTQQEIAHMVGASRESVNKFLMDLTDHGVITLSYRTFVVVDPEGLASRAERLLSTRDPQE
ncbi:MAG: Crp/Fnr family transcriptional regulator [Propionibacteriaceae bacterium]